MTDRRGQSVDIISDGSHEISSHTFAVYIQVHFRLDFLMEAYNINPDQAAPRRAF